MCRTDVSSTRYSINQSAEQIYPPRDTVLRDGHHRYLLQQIQYEQIDSTDISFSRYSIYRWAGQIYPPA
jgi:hypothetical protein